MGGVYDALLGEVYRAAEADAAAIKRVPYLPAIDDALHLFEHPDGAGISERGARLDVGHCLVSKDGEAEVCASYIDGQSGVRRCRGQRYAHGNVSL